MIKKINNDYRNLKITEAFIADVPLEVIADQFGLVESYIRTIHKRMIKRLENVPLELRQEFFDRCEKKKQLLKRRHEQWHSSEREWVNGKLLRPYI